MEFTAVNFSKPIRFADEYYKRTRENTLHTDNLTTENTLFICGSIGDFPLCLALVTKTFVFFLLFVCVCECGF